MALKYKIIKQEVVDKVGITKDVYYARACDRSKVDLNELSKLISRMSTVSRADIIGVLTAFSDIIPSLLTENRTVQLGELGTFSLHMKSDCVDSKEEVTWRCIKDVNIRFRVGKELKNQLKDIHFQRVDE
ncbi:HU family DNA-binding protein [Carboxylicivirga linearis]|uniref:HU family DNA-binding protein n=1 Tax=Carboxylicivirga linearis TaxID=1628157 RepID=A0ABS5JR11_9BACT|nr:HU family DNA-binding protein [Carboxylicivirga linearis]MBS2097250.1 HU family DNA-binding protein [Carboxylicivirga linearis]